MTRQLSKRPSQDSCITLVSHDKTIVTVDMYVIDTYVIDTYVIDTYVIDTYVTLVHDYVVEIIVQSTAVNVFC